MGKKAIEKKIKKRRWDAVLIGTAMSIAFAVILMRFTGYWPCDIISSLNIENIISCSRSPQENLITIYTSIQQGAASVANFTR
jgi:uncharacterized membrane protein YwzB